MMNYQAFFLLSALCVAVTFGAVADRQNINNAAGNMRFVIGNTSYELSPAPADWYAARYNCKWLGMELVSIETEEESTEIQTALTGIEERFWLSLNNKFAASEFYWESTGLRLGPFANWAQNQPNAILGTECVEMGTQLQNREWSTNSNCDEKLMYICESTTC